MSVEKQGEKEIVKITLKNMISTKAETLLFEFTFNSCVIRCFY